MPTTITHLFLFQLYFYRYLVSVSAYTAYCPISLDIVCALVLVPGTHTCKFKKWGGKGHVPLRACECANEAKQKLKISTLKIWEVGVILKRNPRFCLGRRGGIETEQEGGVGERYLRIKKYQKNGQPTRPQRRSEKVWKSLKGTRIRVCANVLVCVANKQE